MGQFIRSSKIRRLGSALSYEMSALLTWLLQQSKNVLNGLSASVGKMVFCVPNVGMEIRIGFKPETNGDVEIATIVFQLSQEPFSKTRK